MSQLKKMKISALNIKFVNANEQKTENYVKLWKFISEHMIRGTTYSKQAIMIPPHECTELQIGKPELGMYGKMYKYYNLDSNSSWLNINNATFIDKANMAKIPNYIKPESKIVDYLFMPKKHTLYFDADNLKPFSAYYAFKNIIKKISVYKDFENIEVIPIADKSEIEKLINLPQKVLVKIKVTLPNPDDLDEIEEDVFRRMKEHNTMSMKIEKKGIIGSSIALEENEKNMIRASRRNGYTEITIKDDNGNTKYNSQKTPKICVIKYNPDFKSKQLILREVAMNENIS